jgi:hypothetical protein
MTVNVKNSFFSIFLMIFFSLDRIYFILEAICYQLYLLNFFVFYSLLLKKKWKNVFIPHLRVAQTQPRASLCKLHIRAIMMSTSDLLPK